MIAREVVPVAGARVAVIRGGDGPEPVVFLHGFGSVKEDYADLVHYDGRAFLAYDAPGSGETECGSPVSVPLLVETLEAVLEHYGIGRCHLVGHSMGGLTALLFAHRHPGRVVSFVDIEGNLAPEDCFLSRQILDHPYGDPQAFFDGFIERVWPVHPGYASNLRHRVRAEAVPGIFASMVDLSDHGDLMAKFLALPAPRMFMYGASNASLSYLPRLRENGVELAEIPFSGHWPMYSNPVAMWRTIATFLGRTAQGDSARREERMGRGEAPKGKR